MSKTWPACDRCRIHPINPQNLNNWCDVCCTELDLAMCRAEASRIPEIEARLEALLGHTIPKEGK